MEAKKTPPKPLKKLTLKDLEQVTGGRISIKIEVENSKGTDKANGEG